MSVVRCSTFVGCSLLIIACYVFCVVRSSVLVVRCSWFVVRGLLRAVRCELCVVCCVFFF